MPTLRQRVLGLVGADIERRRRHLRAWQWARQRLPTHEVHVEDQTVRLFPEGGLEAAASFDDDELQAFVDFVILAQLSYEQFL